LSGTGLCDGLIIHPDEFYRQCCVAVCDLEASGLGSPWPALVRSATGYFFEIVEESNHIPGEDGVLLRVIV